MGLRGGGPLDAELRELERRVAAGQGGALAELAALLERVGRREEAYALLWEAGLPCGELGASLAAAQRPKLESLVRVSVAKPRLAVSRRQGFSGGAWEWREARALLEVEAPAPVLAVRLHIGSTRRRFGSALPLTSAIELDATGVAKFGSRWVPPLKRWPASRVLRAGDTKLGDRGLEHAAALRCLALLDLAPFSSHGTRAYSSSGLLALLAARPAVGIRLPGTALPRVPGAAGVRGVRQPGHPLCGPLRVGGPDRAWRGLGVRRPGLRVPHLLRLRPLATDAREGQAPPLRAGSGVDRAGGASPSPAGGIGS